MAKQRRWSLTDIVNAGVQLKGSGGFAHATVGELRDQLARAPERLEKDLQREIEQRLDLDRETYRHARVNAGSVIVTKGEGDAKRSYRFTGLPAGHLDRMITRVGGAVWWLELKRKGNGPSELQKAFVLDTRGNGGVADCIWDLDQLEVFINGGTVWTLAADQQLRR